MSSQQVELVSETNIDSILNDDEAIFRVEVNSRVDLLLSSIEKHTVRVKGIAEVKDGIVAGKIKDLLFLDHKLDEYSKKLYFGKHLSRYSLSDTNIWVNYKPDEMMRAEIKRQAGKRPGLWMRDERIFNREKILSRFVAKEIIATYDNDNKYYEHTLHSTYVKDKKYKTKYVLAIYNSSLIKFYYQKTNSHGGDLFPQVRISSLENIPIKVTDNETQNKFSVVVDYILFYKKKNIDSSFFERLIDAMVYELYFPYEIQSANCEVFKHLTNLPELQDELSNEKKFAIIENVNKELFNPAHPITVAMERMKTISEVQIIEGVENE